MLPRSAAVIILLSPLAAACGTLGYPVSIETPITATLDVSAFQRVFVAGFSCSGGEDEIDLNDEMVRVLRTELRNKSMLHVIESAPLRPPRTQTGIGRTGVGSARSSTARSSSRARRGSK